jgi:hypothetical protein
MLVAKEINYSEICNVLKYEPDTGIIRWKVDVSRLKAGDIAGSIKSSGYIMVRVNGYLYTASRIAWVLTHGSIDKTLVVDHIDRNPLNNRLSNLRLVTQSENCHNKKHRVSEFGVGITKHKNGKLQVQIRGKYLDLFDNVQDAAKAYQLEASK